jgi:hypothetical protein
MNSNAYAGTKAQPLWRQLVFGFSLLLAVLAVLTAAVGVLQLEAYAKGYYDPVRDDNAPPDTIYTHYSDWIRSEVVLLAVAIAAGCLAWRFRIKPAK